MAILSILAMGLCGLVFQQIRFASVFVRLNSSLPIAQGALKEVFYTRDNDPSPGYDTLDELSRENKVELCEANSYIYYFVDKKQLAESQEIIDEGALINLNTASQDVLARLPGMDKYLAEKLVNSALRPFSSVNEVLLVDGISRENFKLFKDSVTVYGQGKVNINTASKQVLLALGLDDELVNVIIRFRREHEIEDPAGLGGRQTEHGFASSAAIIEDLRGFSSLGLKQEQDLLSLQNVLDVKSEYLRFNIITKANKKEGLHYSIAIHPATKKIISWSEH